jgi:uncharacterized repeat protein (TIGR01451 family)
MRQSIFLRLCILGALLAVPLWGDAQHPPTPVPVLPQLQYVRLSGPPGMKVTVYRGRAPAQTFDAPCVLGFRPGYRYRVQLGGMAGQPGLVLYPSFDVIGSLRLTGGVRPADHPASLVFTEEDFASVRAGNVVNKLVLLERPETAMPVATTPAEPIELHFLPNMDLLKDAQQRGRPLLWMHMGGRDMTPQELADEYVPGTLLLPGERVLPAPRDPPALAWMCYPLVDPRVGQACPEEEICFHDGGDEGLPAGIGPDGKLRGVDPSDTVAQYDDSRGLRRVAISNKVCFCVPRYLVLRNEMTTVSNSVRTQVGDTVQARAPGKAQIEVGTVEHHENLSPAGIIMQMRVSSLTSEQQTSVVGRVEGVAIRDQVQYTGQVTGSCPPPQPAELMDKPLCIIKWPDKCDAQIGEIITFFIRYTNKGQKPITNIAVNDSLTARLEYVAGSARTDRDALFTLTPNEAGSAMLRWEITQPLPPGQSGTVTFQVRVR